MKMCFPVFLGTFCGMSFPFINVFASQYFQHDDLDRPEFPILQDCDQKEVNLVLVSDAAGQDYQAQLALLTKVVDLFAAGQEDTRHLRVAMAVSGSVSQGHAAVSWLFELGTSSNTSEIKEIIMLDRWRPRAPGSSVREAVDFVDGALNCSSVQVDDNTIMAQKSSLVNTELDFATNTSNIKVVPINDMTPVSNSSVLEDDKLDRIESQRTTLIIILSNPKDHTLLNDESELQKFHSSKRLLIVFVVPRWTSLTDLPCRSTVKNPCINLPADTLLTSHTLSLALCGRCFHGWFGPMPTSKMLANYMPGQYNPAFAYTSCYKRIHSVGTRKNYFLNAAERCRKEGVELISIETREEMDYLNSELIPQSSGLNVVFIGLKKDTRSLGKRFSWINGRSLIHSNWLMFHPNGGNMHGCTLWDIYFTGWVDVGCGRWIDYVDAVCEWAKPNYAKMAKVSVPGPANEQSIRNAVSRGQVAFCRLGRDMFMMPSHLTIDTNVCSLHINNTGRLQVLDLPMSRRLLFSCRDESSRSIQFSSVCDQENDCVNNFDENPDMCNAEHHHHLDLFTCVTSGKQVPSESRCDLYQDCLDGSDEENCESCQFGLCSDGRCVPQPWLSDSQKDCWDPHNPYKHDLNNSVNPVADCAFLCNRSKCVPWQKLADGVIDCLGPEGPLDETLGAFEQVDCEWTPSMEWAPRCVFQRDRLGELIGCRNKRHLQLCEEFECPEGYLKCPKAYCIPLHYLQNGVIDCPLGEDETQYQDKPMALQGHFKCDAVNSVFIHPDRICDGSKDCPHGTDEMNCHVTCAEGFICSGGFVVAGDYNRSKSLTNVSFIDPRTRMVELSHMNVSMVLTQLCGLKLIYLIDLRLSNCSIDDLLVGSTCFPRLSKLDLSFNLIRSISTDESTNMLTIYHGAKSLHSLNLSHNIFLEDFDTATLASNLNLRVLDLSHTAISTFPDMHSMTLTLTHLNLSHTRITKLWAGTFPTDPISRPLEILDLRGADIEDVQLVALKSLKIKTHLYSDCFKLCCPQLIWDIPTHVCHAPTDPVSSCSSLIKEKLLNILVWMAGVVSVLGNTGVIVKYLATGRSNLHLSHGQLVIELAMSNLLMGIYLLIIASETIRFNGDYVLHDNQWRQSDMCKAAEFLYSLSSLVSPAFILLLVVDRYLAINNPLQQRPFSSGYILAFSILTWCLGLTLAAVPLLPWTHHWNVYSRNAACVRLPLLANRRPGWEATTAIYIILNCLICLGIASAQFATFVAASAARKALTSNTYFIQHGDISTKTMQELALSRRVATITFTNLPCYLLIGVLGLLALGGHAVGRDAFVWLVLVILPGTSAINPVLYSLPMVQNLLAKTIAKRMASQGPMSQESPSSSRT